MTVWLCPSVAASELQCHDASEYTMSLHWQPLYNVRQNVIDCPGDVFTRALITARTDGHVANYR